MIVTPSYQRIVILGTSGSGKSTLGRALAERLRLKYVELDALHHGPNWTERPDEEFLQLLTDAIRDSQWVVDGNYTKSMHLTWEKADVIVWLDLPLAVVFARIVQRTFRRSYRKEVLWNGNQERLWEHFFTKESLFWWVVSTHYPRRRRYASLCAGLYAEKMVRLRKPREVTDFLARISD